VQTLQPGTSIITRPDPFAYYDKYIKPSNRATFSSKRRDTSNFVLDTEIDAKLSRMMKYLYKKTEHELYDLEEIEHTPQRLTSINSTSENDI
jgi:hypothetical protein